LRFEGVPVVLGANKIYPLPEYQILKVIKFLWPISTSGKGNIGQILVGKFLIFNISSEIQ
jgi:hypothetical protein